jgi:hypothetical protein
MVEGEQPEDFSGCLGCSGEGAANDKGGGDATPIDGLGAQEAAFSSLMLLSIFEFRVFLFYVITTM